MKKNRIILIGGGGHCKSCIDVIEQENKYQIIGIIDIQEKIGQKILGYEIIGCDKDLESFAKKCDAFLVTIGQIRSAETRTRLFQNISKLGVNLPSIISPLAYVSKHAKIGRGSIIMHHAIVNAAAEIGENCIINSRALIEHDAVIGNNCHISTGAIINGGTVVGEGTFFGSGAVSKENINIAKNSFIKANSIAK